MRRARGQTMVLMAMTMLVVTVMIFMTLSIGSRVHKKLELENLADAAAYSQAVATARAMNSLSMLNRASASHWVALMGLQADHAWGTLMPAFMEGCAAGAYMFEQNAGQPPPSLPQTCPRDRQGMKMLAKAAQLFWHADLANWNAPGAEAQDPLNFPPAGIQRLPVARSLGALDFKVGAEQREVWAAVRDLAKIQTAIHDQLYGTLQGPGSLANRIVLASQGRTRGATFPFTVEQPKDAKGRTPPWREFDDSVSTNWWDQLPLANAAAGSRDSHFIVGGYSDKGPTYPMPPRVAPQIASIQSYLQRTYGKTITCVPAPGYLLSTFFYRPSAMGGSLPSSPGNYQRVGPVGLNGTEIVGGQIDGNVTLTYRTSCGPALSMLLPVESTSVAFTRNYLTGDNGMPSASHYWGPCVNCKRNGAWSTIYVDFWGRFYNELEDPNVAAYYPEPPTHRYWGDPPEATAHKLGPELGPDLGVMPGSLGFVFPQRNPNVSGNWEYGAGGAYGQPKSPVLLTRQLTGGGITPEPWDLTFRFRFAQGGPGEQLDFQNGGPAMASSRTLAAFSNAITYYHRRRDQLDADSWSEAPNLLSPYWHATLVPLSIDEQSRPVDNTPYKPAPLPEAQAMLNGVGLTNEAALHQALLGAGYKGIQ